MGDQTVNIKDLLVAASPTVGVFAAESGWSIRIAREPKTPDSVVTIYLAGGLQPNPKWLLDFVDVQVRIRGDIRAYQAAHTKAIQVKDVLLGCDARTVNSDRIVSVTMIGDLTSLGFDDNDRPLFVLNFRLIVEPAASAQTNRVAL